MEIIYRTLELQTRAADEETRTVPAVLSTDTPIERGEYLEILDHGANAVDLSRTTRGLPLLESHDAGRINIGKVDNVRAEGGRLVGEVRFGKSKRAQELWDDVVDGVVDGVSIGYVVRKWEIDEEARSYTARDWMPFEVSAVAVPADPNAGFFRSISAPGVPEGVQTSEDRVADSADEAAEENTDVATRQVETPEETEKPMTEEIRKDDPQPVDVKAVRNDAMADERKRIAAIAAIGKKFDQADLAEKFVESGRSVDEFRDAVLENMDGVELRAAGPVDIGMTDKEIKQFSFVRMLRAQMPGATRKDKEAASYEREVCDAAASQYGREPKGWLIPDDVVYYGQRDLEAGSATKGADVVSTDLLAGSFIDLLRNMVVVERAGATVLTGLQGNVAIPKQTGGPTAYWVAESGTVTESDPTFDQVTMSPQTVGSVTEISRKLLLQSSIDIENFVRREQASHIGIEIDRVAINGSGTNNQPEGILQTTGIGAYSATSGTDAITWDLVVGLWKEVAKDNAEMGSLGWLANAAVVAKLLSTRMDTGSGRFIMERLSDGLLSYPLHRSENVPSDLGSSSALGALIFGNFADLLIGYWSGVDVLVDPYSNSKTGTVRVVTMIDCDVDIRHPESFAATQDLVIA